VSPVLFDRLKLTRALREKARFTQEQAKALADALSESFEERVATKQDTTNLEAKLESLEQRLTIKMGGMFIVAVGVLTGLMKLIHG
jgi:flagellar motility protein MotE (MotC chaperone)